MSFITIPYNVDVSAVPVLSGKMAVTEFFDSAGTRVRTLQQQIPNNQTLICDPDLNLPSSATQYRLSFEDSSGVFGRSSLVSLSPLSQANGLRVDVSEVRGVVRPFTIVTVTIRQPMGACLTPPALPPPTSQKRTNPIVIVIKKGM
jgi:hypothetical protein